ncbi:LLM class flavin-dependent oxidoreductase [Aeromicrobium sp. UC242_57]|uniref:LLM class flavin-dependent oxidoreductase n=1 Tax=Aeromicrobium sp. UC242_57 TaxID=3374624 RepID=UPI00378F34BD
MWAFDYTLLPYHSSSFDPFTQAAAISQHAPNGCGRSSRCAPTRSTRQLRPRRSRRSTSSAGGRAVVHIIAGGDAAEQAREGDYLSEDDRYARAEEFVRILRAGLGVA